MSNMVTLEVNRLSQPNGETVIPVDQLATQIESEHPELYSYARDTWHALTLMVDPATGLPADRVNVREKSEISYATTPSDIGLHMISTVAARDLGFISEDELHTKISQVLKSLSGIDNYEGLFINWYGIANGIPLSLHPSGGDISLFVSTVDNTWLATALMVVRNAVPFCQQHADKLLNSMNFQRLYDGEKNLFIGGFDPVSKINTTWYYRVKNSETRMG